MAAPSAIAIARTVEIVMRQDRGRLTAALIARLGNFQLAEDALQEAAISALGHWGRAGLPTSPQGWLLKVALRKAIDRLRQSKREADKAQHLSRLSADEADDTTSDAIPDERLRLIFTCCHPALDEKSRVALTLRTLCGLSTPEVARAFLDTDTTMGQRLTRAKARIAAAGIPFAVPDPQDWAERLQSVLSVIYLIFNAGYSNGGREPRDLCAEAIFLAQLLADLRPGEAEVEGCLALLHLTHARSTARVTPQGETIALADQDRSLWDAAAIATGLALLDRAIARRRPGPYQIKAAIAACHITAPTPDWPQIAALYDGLLAWEPTPVVSLNRAVALAEAFGPATGLAALTPLAAALDSYQPYHAARADLLARTGALGESRAAYDRAIALSAFSADAAFLIRRRNKLPL